MAVYTRKRRRESTRRKILYSALSAMGSKLALDRDVKNPCYESRVCTEV